MCNFESKSDRFCLLHNAKRFNLHPVRSVASEPSSSLCLSDYASDSALSAAVATRKSSLGAWTWLTAHHDKAGVTFRDRSLSSRPNMGDFAVPTQPPGSWPLKKLVGKSIVQKRVLMKPQPAMWATLVRPRWSLLHFCQSDSAPGSSYTKQIHPLTCAPSPTSAVYLARHLFSTCLMSSMSEFHRTTSSLVGEFHTTLTSL